MVLRTFYAFPALQSSLVSQRKHSKMKARTGGPEGGGKKKGETRTGAGKFSKVELGNRCDWRRRRWGCVSACLRANARARHLCV